jgi:hypothetical protein
MQELLAMRRIALAGTLAALATVAALFATLRDPIRPVERHRADDSSALVPGTPYVADVERDQAQLDLEFQPNSRYIAVISSLARGTGSFRVAASSRSIGAPQFLPRRLPPLHVSPPRAEQAVTSPEIAPAIVSAAHQQASAPSAPVEASRPTIGDGKLQRGASRTFSLHVTDGSLDDPTQYAKVPAREIAVGRNVRIYLDDQQAPKELPPGLVQSIQDLFDNDLIPRFRGTLGTYRDVDGDGRFSILLSPWLGRLQGGRTSIGGFVRGSDFQTCIAPPFSNRCDMMYVNSQTIPGPHLRTLLIHEYTHAVSFSRRTAAGPGHAAFPEEEDWLNEALAHCAESLFNGGWTNLDYRISRYLNDTAAYPLVVEDYYRAGLWRCHGCRGATYLFLRSCVERFGPEVLSRLIATPAHGALNLELATGCPFDRLFRDWTLSLLNALQSPDEGKLCSGSGHLTDAGVTEPARLARLDLGGALGPWGLAGPRPCQWDVDSGTLAVELKATSTAFVEMSASAKPGLRRIRLAGSPGTQLQVSLVRLAEDSPRIEVDASWSRRSSGGKASPDQGVANVRSDDFLRVSVRVTSGNGVTIEQIAAEQNSGEARIPCRVSGESLKSAEVASGGPSRAEANSASGATAGNSAGRIFELPGDRWAGAECPVVVKVVAIDRHGRRSAGWATVRERSREQVAAIAGARH